MKKHRLVFREVDRDGFENIRNGLKPIETRAATTKYRGIKPGDVLSIACGKDSFEKTITNVGHYDSIEKLMADVPMTDVCPGAKSMEDVYKMYFSFPGYKDKIVVHGIMAFHLS